MKTDRYPCGALRGCNEHKAAARWRRAVTSQLEVARGPHTAEKKNLTLKISHKTKHGIDFETAQLVFDDPFCVTFVERATDGEERWHAIGSIEKIIIVVVVHTYRVNDSDEAIRIISGRPATRRERKPYVQAIG
jgi:uncharacterized protein